MESERTTTSRNQMRIARSHLPEFAALAALFMATGASLLIWGWLKSLLIGFSVTSLLYALSVAVALRRKAGRELASAAARHDQRAGFILLSGLLIDISALGLVLVFLTTRTMDAVAVGLAALSIFAAWVLLNMLFAIHYAHVWFTSGDSDRPPLAFPGGRQRAFSDFVYFAFVIGMTFQVSDVAVTDAGMRRLVVSHSILAFMFNVFVLALAVNAVGNLV